MIIHNPILTGSFTVNGTDVSSITSSAANLTALNAITASILLTTGSLNTASGSAITRLSSIETVTGSNITRLSSLEAKTGSYATTGSNTFVDTQTISGSILQSGSFTSTGTLTAQTLVVQTITSSVDFVTGSTRFGSLLANSHVFTGSVGISGSLTGIGATFSENIQSQNSSGTYFQVLNTAGGFAKLEISSNATSNATLSYTNQLTISGGTLAISPATTFSSNVTIGQATAATNVKLFLNGVASKAAGIEFQQGGVSQWYIGNGIASEDNNFELYNSNGTMAMKIIKSTNAINFIGAAEFSDSITASNLIVSNRTKSGTGVESWDGLYLRLFGSNAVGDSINIKFANAAATQIANIQGILGGDNVAYGSLAFSTRNYFTDSMVEVMRINNRGNVGIGTSSPSEKLQVIGNIKVNGTSELTAAGSTSIFVVNNLLSAGSSSGTVGIYFGDVGSGVNTITREKQSVNTSRTVIYSEQGYNVQSVGAFFQAGAAYQGNNSTTWAQVSDIRIKENIRPISDSLNKILALNPCHFEYKTNLGKTKTGFIAQEFEQVFSGHVIESPVSEEHKEFIPEEGETIKSIDADLIPYLVKAIQELKAEFDAYKTTHP